MRIYKAYPNANDREKIAKFLSSELRLTTPFQFKCDSKARYSSRYTTAAMTLMLDDILVKAKVVKRAVYPVGDKKIEVRTA